MKNFTQFSRNYHLFFFFFFDYNKYKYNFVGRDSMKEFKKVLAGLMALSVCFVGADFVGENTVPFVAVAESETTEKTGTFGDNLTWGLDENGTLTISGTGSMGNCIFPNTSPFYSERESIKKVIIEDGVTDIGSYAFYWCLNLTSVVIPDSVTSIGSGAFDCTALTSVTIPDNVTSVGDCAFRGCTNLTSITIPESLTNITYHAFYETPWLEAKRKENPLVVINNILIDAETCSGDVVIPDGITSINENAFLYSDLTSVTIPESVTSIGKNAFADCKCLTSITIPDSVTSIGNDAFRECKSLTSVTIPVSVTSMGDSVFQDCSGLKSVTLPDSITFIGNSAFFNCTGLTSVTIPDSVTSIGSETFWGCTGLTSITILNPDCEIYDNSETISNGKDENYKHYFNGTIYGYENSTAQAYAEKYGYKFELLSNAPSDEVKSGDADGDGEVNINDTVFIMQSIANPDKYTLTEQGKANADVVDNGGGITNADALAIQYVESKTINASDFPITSEELDKLGQ